MTTQVLAPPRRREVLKAAAKAIDALLRDLAREEQETVPLTGAAVPPPPRCQHYQDQAAVYREDVVRLLRNRSPGVVDEVRRRLDSLHHEIARHMALLQPHYRKDRERDVDLADEYWRCALAHSDLRVALEEDWQYIEGCMRAEAEAETATPSERKWYRSLSPEERKFRYKRWQAGYGESYGPPQPTFTLTERAAYRCREAVKLLSRCCPPPRPSPVLDEREAARIASVHGLAIEEARRLLWKEEQLLEPELPEE